MQRTAALSSFKQLIHLFDEGHESFDFSSEIFHISNFIEWFGNWGQFKEIIFLFNHHYYVVSGSNKIYPARWVFVLNFTKFFGSLLWKHPACIGFIATKNVVMFFKSLIGINFDVIGRLQLNSKSRVLLLDVLLEYYQLHLSGFRKPKSLKVLKEVFD